MGWQGFESFAATVTGEKKPTEAHFHKHGYPEKTWVVHEPKDIDCYFNDQEEIQNMTEDTVCNENVSCRFLLFRL